MPPLPAGSLWRGKPRLQLKLDDWPLDDRLRGATAETTADSVLDAGGEAACWSPVTRRTVMKAYGRWLAWLAKDGRLDPTISPLARVTAERVAAYIADLRSSTSSNTVWGYVHGLAMMLDVLVPGGKTQWLWKAVAVLKRAEKPSGRKRGRIVHSSELLAYGIKLMDAAEQTAAADVTTAAAYQFGLIIALMAARPLRMKNFLSIEIGRQLIQQSHGCYLRFEVAEMKTHRELEVSFPEGLLGHLDTYLSVYRPVLLSQYGRNKTSREMKPAGAALWVSAWGTKMSELILRVHVVELTRKKFGKPVNPHLFRDCAATSIALTDPDHVAITTKVLGHTTLSTSERFYNHAMSIKAAEAYQADITKSRRETTRKVRQVSARLLYDGATF